MAERGRRRRERGSGRVRALLSLGVVVGIGATGTYAYWTDSVTVTGTTITAGTIDLKVNNADSVTGYSALDIAAMVPGNSTAGVLTVSNSGTAPLRWSLDASASNADGKGLGAALVVKVTGDAATAGSSPTATCSGSALPGTGASFAADLVPAASPRTLAAGASETICLQATLPTGASSALQAATTTVSLTFTGTSY